MINSRSEVNIGLPEAVGRDLFGRDGGAEGPRERGTEDAEGSRERSTEGAEGPRERSTEGAEGPRERSTEGAEGPRKWSTEDLHSCQSGSYGEEDISYVIDGRLAAGVGELGRSVGSRLDR